MYQLSTSGFPLCVYSDIVLKTKGFDVHKKSTSQTTLKTSDSVSELNRSCEEPAHCRRAKWKRGSAGTFSPDCTLNQKSKEKEGGWVVNSCILFYTHAVRELLQAS